MGLGREKAPFAPIRRNLINVNNMDGSYLSSTNINPLIIRQSILFKTHNDEQSLQLKDELARWLFTEKPAPLEFDDEPGRVYYAVVNNTLDDFEYIANYRRGTIEFLVLDGYGYGHEKTIHFPSDQVIVNNEGTAEADPIFELTATKKSTFAMISNGEDYNLIGQPSDVDEQVVDEKTLVFDEVGDTIGSWQSAPGFNGTFVHGSQGIQVANWGTGSGWHGPGSMKEIDPIQDFEIEFYVYIRSENPNQTYRVSTNFYDENTNELGMMRVWDKFDSSQRKIVEARVGSYQGTFDDSNYLISRHNYDWKDQRVWSGVVRVTRKGNVFTFYAAYITQDGRHIQTITRKYTDLASLYDGKLKFIRIDIANFGNTAKPNEVAINRIRTFEHHQTQVDQTPYIIYPNDVITFDHKNEDILVNGEPRKDLKNFGASFFTLKKGENQLLVTPEDSFETNVRFRERFY